MPKDTRRQNATLRWEADVVIVGGAVAGAAMACACAEQGLSCILLERTKTIKAINRGDVLTPLTIALCERWGVLEHLRALGGYEMYGFSFYSPRLGLLGRWDFRSLNFRFNYELTLSHPKIHEALYAAIANSPCVEVRRGATMRSLVWENDCVAAVTGDYEGKEFCARGRVVVAADGMDSKIRSELGIGIEERYQYAHEYMMFEIPKLKVEEMEHWGLQYVGRKGLIVLIPLEGDRMRVPVQMPVGTLSQWQKMQPSELASELTSRAPLLAGVDVSRQLATIHAYRVFWMHAKKYVSRGVCLLGDAAHVTHPTTAQGMNMAMLDAEVLAAVIKHGKVRNDLSDRTLMLYEEGRRSVVERVMETSHHQTVHHTATGTWHDVWGVREYKWSERDPGLKYDLAISIAGLRNPTAAALGIPEAIEVKGVTEAIKGCA